MSSNELGPHLRIRLKERKIPLIYPKQIISNPDNYYFDPLTCHQIAVKDLKYNKKLRPMVVAYDIIDTEIQIITVYPTTEQEIKNRLEKRRWIKDEKE